MIKLALIYKAIYLKEKHQRLEQLICDLRFSATVILVAIFAATSFFTLFSLIKTHTIPWLHLFSLADELLFVLAYLLSLYCLVGFGQYMSWHLGLKILNLFAGKVSGAGQYIAAVASGPSLLLCAQHKQVQAQTAAFWRQLQERQANRPPDLWPAGQAPLPLFQQAILLLAP